jgi:hypothetical protein
MKLVNTTSLVELDKDDITNLLEVIKFYIDSPDSEEEICNKVDGIWWELLSINGEL